MEVSEENPEVVSLTRALPKRVPRENSKTKDVDKDRCRYCRKIGHWVKDCPQKKDQEKGDNEDTFTGP